MFCVWPHVISYLISTPAAVWPHLPCSVLFVINVKRTARSTLWKNPSASPNSSGMHQTGRCLRSSFYVLISVPIGFRSQDTPQWSQHPTPVGPFLWWMSTSLDSHLLRDWNPGTAGKIHSVYLIKTFTALCKKVIGEAMTKKAFPQVLRQAQHSQRNLLFWWPGCGKDSGRMSHSSWYFNVSHDVTRSTSCH